MHSGGSKLKILFLCTGNSVRSQIAEGWARQLKGDIIEPYSAGIKAYGVNPYAIKVMQEVGVDISTQRSKLVEEIKDIEFDYVITVCSNANESCPVFPSETWIVHVGFDDPSKVTGTDEEILEAFRKLRDEIKGFIEKLPDFFSS